MDQVAVTDIAAAAEIFGKHAADIAVKCPGCIAEIIARHNAPERRRLAAALQGLRIVFAEQYGLDGTELEAALVGIEGKAILSGYRHEVYAPLEAAGWQRLEWDVKCMVTPGKKKSRRTECLWLSPRAQRIDRGLFGAMKAREETK